MQKFIVEAEDHNIRLDRWFKRNQPEMQHSLLQKLLRKGFIRVNGKKAETNLRVNLNDEISVKLVIETREPSEPREKKPVEPTIIKDPEGELKKMTLWENTDFLVINKPHGLASQGGSGIKISVDDIIRAVNEKYRLVHRLDRDTSGVMAIAKKASMAAKFGELLKSRGRMEKIYWALVKGVPPKKEGKIKVPLAKKGEKIERMEVDELGKYALTEYRVMESMMQKLSWLELRPITGRTHQLRVHCAHIGCPIMGDGKYGGAEVFEEGLSNKLHLHARQLIIPELGINVTAPLPEHMRPIAPVED